MEQAMASDIPITEAEAVVMQALWKQGTPMGSDAVVAALADHGWQEPTIKTLLNRLLNKGAIQAERDGRRYLYTAVLRREQWVSRESESLLDRLFGGRVAPLVAHFGKHRKLSRKDIAELKRLLEELDHDK
jgi:BlaI family transcriptional regulator, penicillinase repressor